MRWLCHLLLECWRASLVNTRIVIFGKRCLCVLCGAFGGKKCTFQDREHPVVKIKFVCLRMLFVWMVIASCTVPSDFIEFAQLLTQKD